MFSYGHFSGSLFPFPPFFFHLFIAPLPRVSTYPLALHFHNVRVSLSFLAASHSTDNFFLQTACAGCNKKTFVSVVAVYLGNSFWSCFIQNIHIEKLCYASTIFHPSLQHLIWRCCWFKSTKLF